MCNQRPHSKRQFQGHVGLQLFSNLCQFRVLEKEYGRELLQQKLVKVESIRYM